jgi:hypothetical protein
LKGNIAEYVTTRSPSRKPIASAAIPSRSKVKPIMDSKGRLKLFILAGCLGLFIILQSAYGEDAWRTDFNSTCAQSNDAMALSIPELKMLIEQCDRLQKIIEVQDETVRKVYLKRLQLCKNLYVFVLESKMQEQQQK